MRPMSKDSSHTAELRSDLMRRRMGGTVVDCSRAGLAIAVSNTFDRGSVIHADT